MAEDSPQIELPEQITRRVELLPLEVVRALGTRRAAMREAVRLSGLTQSTVAQVLGLETTHFSRMLKDTPDGEPRYFPDDRGQYAAFLRLTGCGAPLQWDALHAGFRLEPLESELQRENRELKAELERQRAENEAVIRFLRRSKGLASDD